jgi:hypothetical protein
VETVTGLVTTIKSYKSEGLLDSLKLNYLGTTKIENKVLSDFNERMKPSNFQELIVKTSDFDHFFDTVFRYVSYNNVAVLASDMIFSPSKSDKQDIYKYLSNQKNAIQDKFDTKLDSIPVSTLILKFHSKFNGPYIDYKEIRHPINSERPYYITVIGKAEFVDSLIAKVDLKTLNGFEAVQLFRKPLDGSSAKIIGKRNLTIGTYQFRKPATTLEIFDAEPGKDRLFQFPVAVDFSGILAGDEFFTNKANYKFSSEGSNYEIADVQKIVDGTDQSTKGYTHILVLRTADLKPGQQVIQLGLKNTLSKWITDSNSEDDQDVESEKNKNRTFGFMHLVKGIYEAYNNKYQNKNLYNISITIIKK